MVVEKEGFGAFNIYSVYTYIIEVMTIIHPQFISFRHFLL